MNKPNTLLYGLILLFINFSFSGCEKGKNQKDDLQELTLLLTKIRSLAESSRCGNGIEIKSLPMGNKACGGPSSYAAYTNTINEKELEKLIEKYTELEKRYNQKWQPASDCALVTGLRSVKCNNEKLEVVY